MGVINRPIYGERGQKKAAERRFPYNALNAHKPKRSKNAENKMRKPEKELSRSKQIYNIGLCNGSIESNLKTIERKVGCVIEYICIFTIYIKIYINKEAMKILQMILVFTPLQRVY